MFVLKDLILSTTRMKCYMCYIFEKGTYIFVNFNHISRPVCEIDLQGCSISIKWVIT